MDTNLNTNNVTVPVDDTGKLPVNNTSVVFDEKGRLKVTEQIPSVETATIQQETTPKAETIPSIESAVEKELPKEPQPIQEQSIQNNNILTTTPPPEQITTLNVVDVRDPINVEHDLKTTDPLSAQADDDENNFIEGVYTAHGKPKTSP